MKCQRPITMLHTEGRSKGAQLMSELSHRAMRLPRPSNMAGA